jgi:hypothetical protein
MGTDIYLNFKGKTKKDEDAQVTGFSIDAGKVGYLRASIGMANENAVLRELFPDHWEPTEKEAENGGKPFDFKSAENTNRLYRLALKYLIAEITSTAVHHPKHSSAEKMGNNVMDALKGLGFESVETGSISDLRHAVMWLNSLFEFYNLGREKQEAGLKPKIYISW